MVRKERAIEFAKFLYLQRIRGFEVSDNPVICAAGANFFHPRLAAAKSYLEFGSGGSTMLAGRIGLPTITVENDRWFAKAVARRLPPSADIRLLVVNTGIISEWGRPTFATKRPWRLRRWRRYLDLPFELIEREKSPFPDLVLIDGRWRRACALKTAFEASRVGARVTICFDDYAPRPFYHGVEELLGRPVVHGRMAIFEIDGGSIVIPPAALDEAAGDPA
jgi:hypothetical protein